MGGGLLLQPAKLGLQLLQPLQPASHIGGPGWLSPAGPAQPPGSPQQNRQAEAGGEGQVAEPQQGIYGKPPPQGRCHGWQPGPQGCRDGLTQAQRLRLG
jgi:hypothetical protein